MALADGSNFGPYRIIGRLGRGGMATVYRAYEVGLDRQVALKVLPEDSLDNETSVQRFKLEARAVARLVHPHIVPVHRFDVEEATHTPWMALQLIEGGSLANILAQGPLSQRRAIHLLRGIAAALDYAHGQGVLHRDVKPQNVLVAPGDHAYLADFGLARILESSVVLSATGTVLGTPQYMAPEQAVADRDRPLDHRCDIYALGIIAYEMLAGTPPFRADTPLAVLMKHVRDPVPVPSPERVPEELLRPVLKALAKDREDRWANALSFVEALEQALVPSSSGVETPPGEQTTSLPEIPSSETAAPVAKADHQPTAATLPPAQPPKSDVPAGGRSLASNRKAATWAVLVVAAGVAIWAGVAGSRGGVSPTARETGPDEVGSPLSVTTTPPASTIPVAGPPSPAVLPPRSTVAPSPTGTTGGGPPQTARSASFVGTLSPRSLRLKASDPELLRAMRARVPDLRLVGVEVSEGPATWVATLAPPVRQASAADVSGVSLRSCALRVECGLQRAAVPGSLSGLWPCTGDGVGAGNSDADACGSALDKAVTAALTRVVTTIRKETP